MATPAPRPKIAIGHRTVTLKDLAIAAASLEGCNVVLEPAVEAQVKAQEERKGDDADPAVLIPDVEVPAAPLSTLETRAVMFAALSALSQSSSGVRLEVLQFLAAALNACVVPVVASPSTGETAAADAARALTQIILAAGGHGWATVGADPTPVPFREAAARAGLALVTPRPFASEVAVFAQPLWFALGCGGLAAYGLTTLVFTADATASLTLTALAVPLDMLATKYQDSARPHRGQVVAASTLRTLLQVAESGTGKAASEPVGLPSCLTTVAEVNGVAHATAISADDALRTELSLAVTDRSVPSLPLATTLDGVQRALTALAAAAVARTAQVPGAGSSVVLPPAVALDGAASSDEKAAASTLVNMAIGAVGLVNAVAAILATEAATSLQAMAAAEDKLLAEARASEAEREEKAAQHEREEDAAGAAAAAADPKYAAKRAAAAAKKAEKAAKKAAKRSNPTLQLSPGVTELRNRLKDEGITGIQQWATPTGIEFTFWLSELLNTLSSGGVRRKPKIPKGTRDFMPEQMEVRERCFQIIKRVFKRHGGVEIDTPVFELRETLLGKYGEEGGKLVYDLADQGGELLSLRYDLTVPFARFLAMHQMGNIRRYHISRVYRRDNPAIARGRYREFYQCDFDIAGTYAPMLPDAEVIKVACEILQELEFGEFEIKLNHRILLDAILDICGVPASKFRPICSAIDKLDKEPWSAIKEEMMYEKGLSEEVADKIGVFVNKRGEPMALMRQLLEENIFGTHAGANSALAELQLLFQYLEAMNALQFISFDLSLARGLTYYTGVIYEAVLKGESVVGSIAAGGRYDNLVGMFSSPVPCVGVSIGIERIFTIMEMKAKESGKLSVTPVSVLVASIGKGMTIQRLQVCAQLWAAGISADIVAQEDPKMQRQLTQALERGTPYMVVFGDSELAAGVVNVKVLASESQQAVPRTDLVQYLVSVGCPQSL